MLWSPLTMTEAWDFLAKVALHGQVLRAGHADSSGNPCTTSRSRKKIGSRKGRCAMRSQNDKRERIRR